MKTAKYILAVVCSLLLMLSLTSAPAGNDGENPTRFSAEDLSVDKLRYGSSMEDARGTFGNPAGMEDSVDPLTGYSYTVWHYDGMELTFSPEGKLVGAKVTGKGHIGPKDVEVGKTVQDIVKNTYISPNTTSSRIFYWNETFGAFDPKQPDCGYSQANDDGTYNFNFLAYTDPEQDDVRIAGSAVVTNDGCAHFSITFGNNGVISYEWFASKWQP